MSGATNCPETPRQKMIGIMYLVLTAMLALNVSASIVNGYLQVDNSLHAAIETTEESNKALYERFDQALEKNPEKTQEWYDKAQQVKESSAVFYTYVQNFKNQLVFLSEGDTTKANATVSELSRKDDTNIPHLYALEMGNALDLKAKINAYREFLINITGDTKVLDDELRSIFSTDSVQEESGMKAWEHVVFQDMPMCASITILTKLQNDIRHYEGKAVETLMAATDAGDLRVNKFNAYVVPSSKTVVQGTKYSANLILAAIDSTKTPEYYVNGRECKNGFYEIVANTVGLQKIKGQIGYMDQEGQMQYLSVESEYNVTEPMAVISNSDLNIMFRNYNNPFSISVPGVLPHNLSVTCSHASTKVVRVDDKNGRWEICPSANTPDKITIFVAAKIDGKELPMGTQEFRVRDLLPPDAYLQIGDKTIEKDWLSRAELLNPKNKLITSYGKDGLVEAKFDIVSFQVKIGKDVYNVTGDSMEKLIPQIKDRVRSGSVVTFRLIKAKDPGGDIKNLRNLTFEIN